jgi:large subunit ribosomal protein L22
MEVKAVTRFVRISPRKLRLVADMVRGDKVGSAMSKLKFEKKRGAKIIYRTIMSAVSNAETKGTIDVDNLFVKNIYVDGGPTLKRFLPRAQGRATQLIKRTSHLNVVLCEK